MALYYVRPTNGSDAAAGTTFGAAWQTTQYALDNTLAGDEIRLCNEAVETPAATVDVALVAGTADAPIMVVAGDSIDGTPLTSGHYTISGISLPAITDLFLFSIGVYITFDRVRFTAATRIGVAAGAVDVFGVFNNCRFDNNATDGLYVTNTTGYWRLVGCEFDANSGRGIGINASGRLNVKLYGSSIHDNTGIGAQIGGDAGVVSIGYNEIYDNGADGLQLLGGQSNGGGSGAAVSNTVYGNTGNGIYVGGGFATLLNNTSSLNGGNGFNFSATGDDLLAADYNHTYNNTSGASNITLPGDNNQTGDPQFASVTDGSEDFTPANGSPLDSNGINGVDIGARKAADPVGGAGGGCKMAGKSGGMVG